jgi:Beta-ketoacyl synthase, N-terminal domain
MQPQSNEPIAIVGIGSRFPGGVRSPQDLDDLLIKKRSGTVEVPVNCRDAVPTFANRGASTSRAADSLRKLTTLMRRFSEYRHKRPMGWIRSSFWFLKTACHAIEDAGIRLDHVKGFARFDEVRPHPTLKLDCESISWDSREVEGPRTPRGGLIVRFAPRLTLCRRSGFARRPSCDRDHQYGKQVARLIVQRDRFGTAARSQGNRFSERCPAVNLERAGHWLDNSGRADHARPNLLRAGAIPIVVDDGEKWYGIATINRFSQRIVDRVLWRRNPSAAWRLICFPYSGSLC